MITGRSPFAEPAAGNLRDRLAATARALAAGLLFTAPFALPCHAHASASQVSSPGANTRVGEAIYRDGVLRSGAPLVARRDDGMRIAGAGAACTNCHQRSGLGSTEGLIIVPPITGRYLFFDPRAPTKADLALPYVEGMRLQRAPYTDATLARAIREGVGADGKPLSYLMPHFALNDADMAALIAYLKHLDQHTTRGVTHTVVHFATIITPDADPVKRKGMLDVLKRFFDDKNLSPVGPTPRLLASHKTRFWVNPRWQLHVWQLTGPPQTWQAQLKEDLRREPVFAVISGLGGANWAPVHAFCEKEALPCLFPNVDAPPPGADHDYYSLYFSRGVLLEADLIAKQILARTGGKAVKSVVQIYRAGDSGGSAARELVAALKGHGIVVRNHVLSHGALGHGVSQAVRKAAASDALVLWLRPADVAALGTAPTSPDAVFMSGRMAGLERAPLPPSWRKRTHLAYSVDLPDQRRINLDFALGWFRIRRIPVVAERVQADTYLACGVLSGTMHRMADTFVADYLVERIQDMLDDRLITGYYPHLTLASGQRFASKGGYLVHFSGAQGTRVVADDTWSVP